MTLILSPDAAQFRGLAGIVVEKAQATLGGGGAAGLAALGLGLTARIRIPLGHVQAQRQPLSVAREEARTTTSCVSLAASGSDSKVR
jgi:hypothetical protein